MQFGPFRFGAVALCRRFPRERNDRFFGWCCLFSVLLLVALPLSPLCLCCFDRFVCSLRFLRFHLPSHFIFLVWYIRARDRWQLPQGAPVKKKRDRPALAPCVDAFRFCLCCVPCFSRWRWFSSMLQHSPVYCAFSQRLRVGVIAAASCFAVSRHSAKFELACYLCFACPVHLTGSLSRLVLKPGFALLRWRRAAFRGRSLAAKRDSKLVDCEVCALRPHQSTGRNRALSS